MTMTVLCVEHEIRDTFYQHCLCVIKEHDRHASNNNTQTAVCPQYGNLVNKVKHI